MKKTLLFVAIAMAVVSCSKFEENGDVLSKGPVFTAGIEQVKTVLDIQGSVGKITWVEGDTIVIYDAAATKAVYVAQQSGARSTFVARAGEPELGAGPYSAKYNPVITKKQQYSATETPYLTMAAESDNLDLTFKATCGVLNLRLVGEGISIRNIMIKGPATDLYYLYCGDGIDISSGTTFSICLQDGETHKKIYLTDTNYKTAIYTLADGNELSFEANKVKQAAITGITASAFDCIYLGSRVNGETMGYPVCWAECNIGAEHCYDAGYYFQWGSTTGYAFVNEKWQPDKTFSKNDEIATEITVDNDAARVLCGGSWRLPLRTEVEKLVKYTDPNVWYDDYKGTGAKGVEITGNTGAKLFLPAVGYGNSTSCKTDGDFYWANNTTYGSGKRPGFKIAKTLADKHYLNWQDGSQHLGFPIRPVKD